MKSATLTYGAGPGSTITLTPETVKVRDAIIAKFSDKSLAELNNFIDTALSTEGDDNKRLGILAARVYILRMRLQNISSFNRDPSQDTLIEISPANLTHDTNTAPEGKDQNNSNNDESDETYKEWNELITTEAGEINGVRIPKGVTVTVGIEDARRLIETNKAVFAHSVAPASDSATPAEDSPAETLPKNSEEEVLDEALLEPDNLSEDSGPVAENNDLTERQPPQKDLVESVGEEVDDDAPATQK
jgi:hypothetical protein